MKESEKLFNLIPKLDAVEFTGLARLLKVQLLEEKNPEAEQTKDKYEPRGFVEVLNDVMIAYDKQNRNRKREILKLVKDATKIARGPLLAGRLEALRATKVEGEESCQ